MKRKITLFRLTIVIAVLASVGIAMAVVTPPPANQELGIYDTVYSGFDEAGCRACHSSGVPNTHHMLIVDSGYECTDCHPPGPNGGVTAIRDCVVCHDSSPHHNTDAALDQHCSECHGSFVDDYDDGHYIPDYEPSLITPEPGCKPDATNDTTGKKWGGCLACHEPDLDMHPVIDSNRDTHHGAVGGKSCDVGICHAVTGTEPPIRGCEACHAVNSIHNIQYDYENTKGVAGYGHIGENWDCIGCHGWVEYKIPRSPTAEIVVPYISAIIPSSLVTGEETEVTIVGSNFVTTSDGTTYTSNVVIQDEDGVAITLEPDTITATELTVTIPGLDTGNYGVQLIKTGLKSNLLPVPVAPEVSIESATVDPNGTVTVIGTGFGKVNPKEYNDRLGIGPVKTDNIKVKKIVEEPKVKEWEDTQVVFSSAEAREDGARFDISTPYGSRKSVPITKPTP
jgi:hypothetical protein